MAKVEFKKIKIKFEIHRVIALSSWDQIGASNLNFIEPSVEHKFLPWEQRGRLVDAEAEILRLFELRQRKEFAVPGRMNTSEALFALQVCKIIKINFFKLTLRMT